MEINNSMYSGLQQIDRARIIYPMLGIIFILILLLGGFVFQVQAQTGNLWTDPENLSNSGSASNPVFVIDSDGSFHIVWMDEYSGLIYVSGDGSEWSVPIPIELPSREVVPFLIADGNGNIHALWRDEQSRLFYSQVRATGFSNLFNWSPSVLISEAALDFDATLDGLGDLHLSYVKQLGTEGSPAGVYYRRLRNGSSVWLTPKLLYESPYFRTLDQDSSNVEVSTSLIGEAVRVFVAWDNRPRERVFLTYSDDIGVTWDIAEEVDQPEAGQIGSGPANIKLHSGGEAVIRVWQVGEQDELCNQYYQVSQDRGETWSKKQSVFEDTPLCLENIQFIDVNGLPILIGKADQVYFSAWDGERWSDPQPQESITSFLDPDTQKLVRLGCNQATHTGNSLVHVVGCDEELGGDIWLLKRQMDDVSDWFPVESGWKTMEQASSALEKIASPIISNDENERIHLFWSQAESQDPSSLGKEIFYSVRKDDQWSPSTGILSSPTGKAEQVSVAENSAGNLFVVWSGGHGGEIFFSQANSDQAFESSSWSEPIELPAPVSIGSSPEIIVDQRDNIHVAYAIPLNEQRGIYFTNSFDLGQSWSNQVQVFDAQNARWDMVDRPVLSRTDNGDLHIIWTRYSLPSGEGPLELYYAKSQDDGETWSSPQLVVEGPVVWSQIIGVGERTVQRVWQQKSRSGSTLWHEQSIDGGETWERIAPVSIFGEILGNPSLSSDIAGRLHLLLVVRSGIDSYFLQHWVFDGQSWTAETSNNFQFSPETEIKSVSSDISDDGLLAVALLNSNLGVHENGEYQLSYTDLELDVPESESITTTASEIPAEVIPTQIPTVQATEPAQPVIQQTPTQVNFPEEAEVPGNINWLVIAGPVLVGIIALVLIVLVVRWLRK
jgi:hypothetical protein